MLEVCGAADTWFAKHYRLHGLTVSIPLHPSNAVPHAAIVIGGQVIAGIEDDPSPAAVVVTSRGVPI